MTDLTPERIRDAADVVTTICRDWYGKSHPWGVAMSPTELRNHADRMERDHAVKAKRDKRIEELAQELCAMQGGNYNFTNPCWEDSGSQTEWRHLAHNLLDRYPSLLDEPKAP